MRAFDIFDRVFVINLDHRTDRLEQFVAGLETFGVSKLWINQNLERFSAVKSDNGADGCRDSHIAILKIAKERGYKNILVFEDDCQFVGTPNDLGAFCKQLNLVNWDIAYLGWNSHEPLQPFDLNLLVAKEIYSTHAIAYNNTVYDRIIEADNFAHIGILDVYYREQLQKGLSAKTCFASYPLLCSQFNGHSDITGQTEDMGYIVQRAIENTKHIVEPPMLHNLQVTICIPCYEMHGKGAEFLRHSLEIIARQTYKNLHVVVGDQSNDNSIEDCVEKYNAEQHEIFSNKDWHERNTKYAFRIKSTARSNSINANMLINYVWEQIQLGRGVEAGTINDLPRATDGLFKILFQDDFLLGDDSIEKLVRAYKSNAGNWVVSGCMHTNDGIELNRPLVPRYHKDIWKGENTISSPSVLAFDVNEYFDDRLQWLMDCEMYHRLYLNYGEPIIVPEALVVNRDWEGNLSKEIPETTKQSELDYLHTLYNDNQVHPRGFWLINNKSTAEHAFDPNLCNAISAMLKKENAGSIIDFGCGLGDYVKQLRRNGFNAYGVDGNPNTPTLTGGLCGVVDLTKKITVSLVEYDWAISLEVGEHIPKEYEHIFLDNIVQFATSGVILSWAVVGQGGLGHVNCQNNDYVIDEMEKRGFTYVAEVSQLLRDIAKLPWFKNTLMVFKKN
jgi:hypothetical protein